MKINAPALVFAIALLSPQAVLLADDGGSTTSKTGMGTPAQPSASSDAKPVHKHHKHRPKATTEGTPPATTTKPAG